MAQIIKPQYPLPQPTIPMADVIKARDAGDTQTLQQMITEARAEAQQANTAPAYEKLAAAKRFRCWAK